MIGKQLSPILCEIEQTLLEFECNSGLKPEYTTDAFRASIKIFMSVMMDKLWELQEKENISMDDRMKMAEKLGSDIKNLVKIYTDINTLTLYS